MKKSLKKVNFDKEEDFFIEINFSAEELMIEQEIVCFKQKSIVKLLNELSSRQKEVLYLKYYSDLSIDEIANVLEINYQSVLNLIHKGIKKLREKALLSELLKNIV